MTVPIDTAIRTALDNVGRVASRFDRELPADVLVGDDDVLAIFDAPGADVTDVDVDITDGVVTVHVERFRPYREGFTLAYPGRSLSLEGRAALPEDVPIEAAAASATVSDTGVVRVRIPRRPDDETDDKSAASADEDTDDAA
jgi:HSP20 family molecular chaperone IbpA